MKKSRKVYHLHIRRNKRLINSFKRDKLLTACLENDANIFEEIRKQRKCKDSISSTIDGHSSKDIPDYLANKYKSLYNGINDEDELDKLRCKLDKLVQNDCFNPSLAFSGNVLQNAAFKLKSGKTDPVLRITSDCLLNGPYLLFDLLSLCLQSYVIHSHVSDFLLFSTLLPIIKDKLGDHTSSSNYRSIAISSLIMKIFDYAIIDTCKEALKFDELQFGYQTGISTSMCTWVATETISYFLRNHSEVFTCLMDMSKAFDLVKHSVLLNKLIDTGMPPLVIRFILASYSNQKANVKWNGQSSYHFSIKNGVKQGAVLSAVLYCIYTNGLFEKLRKLNIGCKIGTSYNGGVGYADDIFLMCPTLDGLQKMLNVCEDYAKSHNLKFSTHPNPIKSKTKCIGFLLKKRDLPQLYLCGNPLPWVESGKHLGTKIESTLGKIFAHDINEKRAHYIQRNNELLQEFSHAHPLTKVFINQVYNTSFYSSVLWDLWSKEVNSIFATWNTSIRIMNRLDRKSHRYLIEPISNKKHIKTCLIKRCFNFSQKLENCKKKVVSHLFKKVKYDCTSTIGRNLRNIALEARCININLLNHKVINDIVYHKAPDEEKWRIQMAKDLLHARDSGADQNLSKDEISCMLDYICTT